MRSLCHCFAISACVIFEMHGFYVSDTLLSDSTSFNVSGNIVDSWIYPVPFFLISVLCHFYSHEWHYFQYAPHLSDEELEILNYKHNGGYSTWSGALLHVADKSQPDLSYASMRLTGYNANPKEPCFEALHQTMCYLFHHPHIPIMYSRKYQLERPLELYVKDGKAEFATTNDPFNRSCKLRWWFWSWFSTKKIH